MSKKNIIYILPHHDDEMFVTPKITSDIAEGHNLIFYFLMHSELRLKESKKYLSRLGISPENIISTNPNLDVQDGSIHLYLKEIYQEIHSTLKIFDHVDEIICTAYEGGHNDHDIASILSRALAKIFNSKLFEFYLYNGDGTRGKFYKVAHPINSFNAQFFKYRYRDYKAIFTAPIVFISQWSAMAGLWPFLMLKMLLRKPLTLSVFEPHQLALRKHNDTPLYERWGRIDQEKLLLSINDFLSAANILK